MMMREKEFGLMDSVADINSHHEVKRTDDDDERERVWADGLRR